MPRGKAGGADDVTREAIDSCPEALDDLLHLTAACIQQGKFPPTVALVLFVLIYKGTGDINDLSRSRAIGLQTLVLKMACGWLTLTRLSPLIATNLPRTQTAYQRHLSVESNIMWATQVIGHVLALGRSAEMFLAAKGWGQLQLEPRLPRSKMKPLVHTRYAPARILESCEPSSAFSPPLSRAAF